MYSVYEDVQVPCTDMLVASALMMPVNNQNPSYSCLLQGFGKKGDITEPTNGKIRNQSYEGVCT